MTCVRIISPCLSIDWLIDWLFGVFDWLIDWNQGLFGHWIRIGFCRYHRRSAQCSSRYKAKCACRTGEDFQEKVAEITKKFSSFQEWLTHYSPLGKWLSLLFALSRIMPLTNSIIIFSPPVTGLYTSVRRNGAASGKYRQRPMTDFFFSFTDLSGHRLLFHGDQSAMFTGWVITEEPSFRSKIFHFAKIKNFWNKFWNKFLEQILEQFFGTNFWNKFLEQIFKISF